MDLKSAVLRLTTEENVVETGLDGFLVYRVDQPQERLPIVISPAVGVIVQGQKAIYLGDQKIVYDENNYLICSTKMPAESDIKDASPEKPYLGMVFPIDPSLISELLVDMDELIDWPGHTGADRIITPAPLNRELEDSLVRLLDLVGDPLKMKVLCKALFKEVFFHILRGERGYVLRNCVLNHARAHKVVPIIQYMEKNFTEPLEINDIAEFAGMSPSSLYSQFKSATSLSPIQFIKRLRLHHAHGLLMEGISPGEAAFESGYGSQPQFCREFKRQFGFSPGRAKSHLQAVA